MTLPRILIIDDLKTRAQQVESIVQFLDYPATVLMASDGQVSLDALDDVMLIMVANNIDKQASLLKNIVDQAPKLPVLLVIDRGTALQVATPILKMVAQCLEWPTRYVILNEILIKYRRLFEQNSPKSTANVVKNLAGKSPSISKTRALIKQVANSEATVLILGESGTGKEVVAQTLHRLSSRCDKPFVPVNCGAIPGELLESELFGHEKGAFTGALNSRQGRFELAEGGTLFLDEIGDMPMTMQVKLLRVLQERTFERVGSSKSIECDVRIIAATHRQLENEIKENRFREDLFYRLNVFPIELPALRERTEDIPELISDLVVRLQMAKKGSVRFTSSALQMLKQYPWPGNVRELANLIERLAIIKPDGLVDGNDLPEKFQQYRALTAVSIEDQESADEQEEDATLSHEDLGLGIFSAYNIKSGSGVPVIAQLPEDGIDLKEYLNDMETDLIRQALTECNGVVAHAAKRLNMRRTTLVEKLRKFDVSRG